MIKERIFENNPCYTCGQFYNCDNLPCEKAEQWIDNSEILDT